MKSTFFGALVLCGAVLGCGSSGGTGGAGGNGTTASGGTTKASTGTGTKTTSSGTTNPQGTGGMGGAAADNTAGKACTADTDCDVTHAGNTICNNGMTQFFNNGTLNPTAVCQPTASCDLGDGMTIQGCDGTAGICLETATAGQGLCLGACQFDDMGALTTPCAGKNLCNVDGFGTDMTTMKPFGVGYCLGGCLTDADCTVTGEKCNTDNGLCETATAITPPTKTVGTPCVSGDMACECGSNTTFPNGFCIDFCKTGVATGPGSCPANFECTTGLPTTGTVIFTKEIAGAAGLCIPTCTADTDCLTGTGATHGNCYLDAGHTNKTCHLGPAQ